MNSMNAQLKVLGLTEEEIQIYLLVLQSGSMTVLSIARKTKIPRTTVYLHIDSLQEKNLLECKINGKKKQYVASSPKQLLKIAHIQKKTLDESLHNLQQELPRLELLYGAKHQRPTLRYYEGIDEVKTIYEETLQQDKLFVQCMSQQASKVMGDYLEKYFARVLRRMIHTKEIVSDSTSDRAYQKNYSTERNEIICIPSRYSSETDYVIYGDSVALITYKDATPVGVVITDKEIASFERTRFLLIWERFSD